MSGVLTYVRSLRRVIDEIQEANYLYTYTVANNFSKP